MYMRLNMEAISDAAMVRVIRRVTAAALEGAGATEETIDRAMLVVGEACGNVVRHAYDEPSLYEVSLEFGADSLVVTVLDYGRGFDTGDMDTEQPGLSIMENVVDILKIESVLGKGTCVRGEICLA